MENEVFGAARAVPCELLVTMPTALDRAIQDVTHRLVDRVLCELEKGESICSLQTVEQNQFADLNSVEIRRMVKIKPLVRCKDCKWYSIYETKKDGTPDKRYSPSVCLRGQYAKRRDPDWFCADGEREVQE